MPRHYPDSAKRENFCGGWDFQKAQGELGEDWSEIDFEEWERQEEDPRLISLIRRWLKAGILEDGEIHPSEEGTPQGGSISVLLSNLYLHYVLDLWFERVVRPRLRGEAYLVRPGENDRRGVSRWRKIWANGLPNEGRSPKSGRRMAAEGMQFSWWWNCGTISLNLGVIWEMSM